MKKVFSSAEDVIHIYAQRNQSEGRCSNVFFYGDKIYSYGYHYLLGEFLDSNTILINDSGYSITTRKHLSFLSYGTRQYKQFFTSKVDIDKVSREIKYCVDRLAKAKKPEIYINQILNLWESINEFIEYRKDKNTPKDVRYKEIKKIVKSIQDNGEEFTKKLAEAKKKEILAKKKRDAKAIKEVLSKFYTYEQDSFRIGDEDFLRISLDKANVETSQGVKVSVEEAKKLYLAIKSGVDIVGKRIEHYTVNSINGHLVIGCHNINMDSVKKVGEELLTI